MGNSNTSRYADGKELYHQDAAVNQWLRSLLLQGVAALEAQFIRAARRARTGPWAPTRRAVGRAPAPASVSPRRAAGEVARLLMDPEAGARIRRLARKHRLDEGDVAGLWAATVTASAAATLPLALPEAEPA
ncbi:MAG: hypothetical protein HYT80_04005 [Euryarchaeota archaeon]|nr:hypothetical protein [Euryarchaeota archaeon]